LCRISPQPTSTKRNQRSIRLKRGIQPDVLICRSEQPLSSQDRNKIALFTNVEKDGVISLCDAKSIYQIPMILHEQSLDEIVVKKLRLSPKAADLSEWQKVVDAQAVKNKNVKIALVGKYVELTDAYKSINEALIHAGIHSQTKVDIIYIDADLIEKHGTELLKSVDAILVPGGFGERGVEGMIKAIQYARENNIPFLGICLGLQTAVIEFARNVAYMKDASSTEFDKKTPYPVVGLLSEWLSTDGAVQLRDENVDLGGSMRLGAQICKLEPDSKAYKIYGSESIVERHRHRYEVNNNYVEALVNAGLHISGRSVDGSLVEMIELDNHPWFVACQFHPEFTSTPRDTHPLFLSFVLAACDYHTHNKE